MTQSQNYTGGENSDAIRADIDQTRNQMSNRIDRIQERISPENIRQQAQETVRTAMHDGADAVVGYVRDYAPELGSTLVDTIKRNPVPAALIGLGIGWLFYENMSSQGRSGSAYPNRGYAYSSPYGYNSRGYSQGGSYGWSDRDQRGMVRQVRQQAGQVAEAVGDRVSQVTDAVGDRISQVTGAVSDAVDQVTGAASDRAGQVSGRVQDLSSQVTNLGSQTRQGVRQAGYQAQNLVESNPMSLGLAALAIGAAIGLALPATRRESQIMGQWRDQVVDKAQAVAGDIKQRVQEVVEEVKPELQSVASMVVDDVKETGKAAVAEAKDAVKRAGTTAQEKIGETVSTSLGSAKSESSEQRQPESEGSTSKSI